MKQNDKRFEAYARLVVEVGSNVQAGVPVWIQASVETAPFVRLVTRYAYEKVPQKCWWIGAMTRFAVCVWSTRPWKSWKRCRIFSMSAANTIAKKALT